MYKEAYNLLREILNDEQLNSYIFNTTGKYLSVIDAGPQIDSPAAKIIFDGGQRTRKSNTIQQVDYIISFALPFFGADAFEQCLDFIEIVTAICLEYYSGKNFIKSVNPSIVEEDNEKGFWTVNINVAVQIFIS